MSEPQARGASWTEERAGVRNESSATREARATERAEAKREVS
jgi:hypothetical protein